MNSNEQAGNGPSPEDRSEEGHPPIPADPGPQEGDPKEPVPTSGKPKSPYNRRDGGSQSHGRGEHYHIPENGFIPNPLYSSRIGNQRCVCGSGKKVKKCCGSEPFIKDERRQYVPATPMEILDKVVV